MALGHVGRIGGEAARPHGPDMARNPVTIMEDLDGAGADADIATFADQLVRNTIVVAVDLDVVVDV
jgi:hypothetical protein